jgi:glycosyltransferase involved in cell wall biosynthesis
MSLPLSVFIICRDEVERIGLVLDSVKNLSDDIVIVDSGSVDGTLETVKNYTDRIYTKKWEGFGPQKVYAESLCKHEWILNLDADEILLSDIQNSIRALFQKNEEDRAVAYSLKICHVSHLSKTRKPRPFCPVNITPRLYNKNKAGFKNSAVHDKLEIFDGSKPEILKGDVAHISLKSFSHMRKKIKSYSTLQAQDWFDNGRHPSLLKLSYDPLAFFFKSYFIRRLCFVGYEGFVISCAISVGRAQRILLTRKKWKSRL